MSDSSVDRCEREGDLESIRLSARTPGKGSLGSVHEDLSLKSWPKTRLHIAFQQVQNMSWICGAEEEIPSGSVGLDPIANRLLIEWIDEIMNCRVSQADHDAFVTKYGFRKSAPRIRAVMLAEKARGSFRPRFSDLQAPIAQQEHVYGDGVRGEFRRLVRWR